MAKQKEILTKMREKNQKELLHEVADKKKEISELGIKRYFETTANVHTVRNMRRELARLLTLAREAGVKEAAQKSETKEAS